MIRDRIKELRRVPASELFASPKNWRTHPESQVKVLDGILGEIGYADALLARELPDGSLELIDGHCRRELTPDQVVPVLVVDLDEDEAAKLMTVLDPLAAMAETNKDALGKLLANVQTDSDALHAMLKSMAVENHIDVLENENESAGLDIGNTEFRVIVNVSDETAQAELIKQLEEEGFKCLPLMS